MGAVQPDPARAMIVGIDEGGRSYIKIENNYFYDAGSLAAARASYGIGHTTPNDTNAAYDLAYGAANSVVKPGTGIEGADMSKVIGKIRALAPAVGFFVYVAPPPPTPPTAPTPEIPNPPPPLPPVAPTYTVPSGYKVMKAVPWGNSWVWIKPPNFDANGMADFSGIPTVTGSDSPMLRLDPVKLNAGLYAISQTDKGQIMLSNGRTYSLIAYNIIDISDNNHDYGTFYYTVEGGGSGNWFQGIAPIFARVVTDVGTLGTSEIVRAVDSDIGEKVEAAYTAGVVGGAAAVLTGGVLAPAAIGSAFVSGAVAGEVAGITGAVQGQKTADILEGAGQAGLIAGGTTGLFSAAANAPPPPTGSDLMGPVTITPDTAGSTLLPPNLSLIQAPPPPSLVLAGPPPPITFDENPLPHLPMPPNPADSAGSTLLPPDLSLVEPPAYTPPVVPTFGPPVPGTGPFYTPPSKLVPTTPMDVAGSTLLPPQLSATPPPTFDILPPPGGSTSLLSDIINAGKVAVPGAVSGYQLYKKLTTPDATASSDGGGTYIFGGDPHDVAPPVEAPKPSYAAPIVAGLSVLLLLGLKTRAH